MKSFFQSLNKRIVAISGAFGSGKTEVAVNFTEHWAREAEGIAIADLDIVNLYFRSRDVRKELEAQGIKVIAPGEEQVNADLPSFPRCGAPCAIRSSSSSSTWGATTWGRV